MSIIFQDNFDSQTGDGCIVNAVTPPDGWDQWMCDGISASHDSVTHYSGEITATGRGGSGKSLKLWRHSDSWVGSASYAGSLLYTASGYTAFTIRFYAKMPTALDMYGGIGTKMFRLNTSGGEIYININPTGEEWHRGASKLQILTDTWRDILSESEMEGLWDGDWHCWQFVFDLTAGTLAFYADGTLMETVNHGQTGSWNSYMQHFPLGNAQCTYWQDSWQAFEVDDLIIATTKAETDPDDAWKLMGTDSNSIDKVTGTALSSLAKFLGYEF